MGCSGRLYFLTLVLCVVTELAIGVRVVPKRKKGKLIFITIIIYRETIIVLLCKF